MFAPRVIAPHARAETISTSAATNDISATHAPVSAPAIVPPPRRPAECACGGTCPRCRAAPAIRIGPEGDVHEHEAERLADRLVRSSVNFTSAVPSHSIARRAPAGAGPVPPAIAASTPSGTGRALDPNTRGFFETRLGIDLDAVRIHDDSRAAEAARAVAARAYTVGSDIVFGAGEYQTATPAGRALLAHELVHVRQHAQDGGPAAWLRRQPCPSCHKPEGIQEVQVEDISDDDVNYLPDEAAVQFFELMRDGGYWVTYSGAVRKGARSVRYASYDGTTQIVGYVLRFEDTRGSNFPRPILMIDVYGNEISHSYSDPEAIESVLSPVDFIGPGLLTKPFLGGARALGRGFADAAPRWGAALSRNARNLAFSARIKMGESLAATIRGTGEISALTAESAAPSALVIREGGELAIGSTQTGRAATSIAEGAPAVTPPVRVTGPSFADVSSDLGLQAPGTTTYRSTAAAASGAVTGNLVDATRPGFQSHSTASSVRKVFNVTGADVESAHIVPQAVYRALRASGLLRARGIRASEYRAFTTNLPKNAHRAFDRGWVGDWKSAVDAGREITVRDLYRWLKNAINNVDDQLIGVDVKGAIIDRLRTELFVDLDLGIDDVIVAARP